MTANYFLDLFIEKMYIWKCMNYENTWINRFVHTGEFDQQVNVWLPQ